MENNDNNYGGVRISQKYLLDLIKNDRGIKTGFFPFRKRHRLIGLMVRIDEESDNRTIIKGNVRIEKVYAIGNSDTKLNDRRVNDVDLLTFKLDDPRASNDDLKWEFNEYIKKKKEVGRFLYAYFDTNMIVAFLNTSKEQFVKITGVLADYGQSYLNSPSEIGGPKFFTFELSEDYVAGKPNETPRSILGAPCPPLWEPKQFK